MHGPLGYRIFTRIIRATKAAREDERGWRARAVRRGVAVGVSVLQRLRSLEFPARATGGWYWVWRWRFEFLMGWFECESVAWVSRVVRPGMTVLDLGAHIGYYSRILSRLVGPQGKVFAFEPNPENLAILRRNLHAPRYSNVEILPYAASDRGGRARLFVSPGHSNHSLIEGFSAAEDEVGVETVSVDAFLDGRGIGSVDFVKMDIEGAEPLALTGMRQTIGRSPRLCVMLEFNPSALEKAGTSPQPFFEFIGELGLRPKAILEDGRLGAVSELSAVGSYVNLLCCKAEETAWHQPETPGLNNSASDRRT